MMSAYCITCKYCSWMVGIGLGVRCWHPKNQKYKTLFSGKQDDLGVLINKVPKGCSYKELKESDL